MAAGDKVGNFISIADNVRGANPRIVTPSTPLPVTGSLSVSLSNYTASDIDVGAAEPNYYGFLDPVGQWKIIKEESETFRYVYGASDYATNWTNRAGLTYGYFDVASDGYE